MGTCEFLVLIEISVILIVGIFIGSCAMFIHTYKSKRALLKELDSKTRQLEQYQNKYLDDGYEAY